MKPLRWVWIATAIICGFFVDTSIGWIMVAITVVCLIEPVWDRITANGRSSFWEARKVIASVLSAILLFGSWSMSQHREQMADLNKSISDSEATIASIDAQYPRDNANQRWVYDTTTDPLTDKPSQTACIESRNAVELQSPYENTRAKLCLRNSPQHGRDVFIKLQKQGQILCDYNGCQVPVRFDKNKVRDMTAGGADDHATNIIFLADRKAVEEGIMGAQQMLVQLRFYEAGNQALTFDVKGLAWPKG